MTFVAEPDKAYFEDIQNRVAQSIVYCLFQGDDGDLSQAPMFVDRLMEVFSDQSRNHNTMLAELKFKTALRELSKHVDGIKPRINGLWSLLASGIVEQRPLNESKGDAESQLDRQKRKTTNSYFGQFAKNAKNIELLNANNNKLALWSGGAIISEYATALGYNCLEATAIGGLFHLIKIYRNDKSLWSLWDYLAKEFCQQLRASGGVVHAFVRTFDNRATLFETEYPSLLAIVRDVPSAQIQVNFHVLVELNANQFPHDLGVVGEDGKRHVFRSLGPHGLVRESTNIQSFTYEDPYAAYQAQNNYLKANRDDPRLDQAALKRVLETPFAKPC